MNPMIFPLMIGGLVIAMIVLLWMALRRNPKDVASDRLDAIVGRNIRKDSSADMLLKQALQEADKKSVLDRLTPEFFNLTKTFEQADCNIKPSALFGISLGLSALGAALCIWLVNVYVVPVGALLFFCLPWLWLYQKRASRLKKFASQLPDAMELVARALRAGHSLAAGMHVVAEEMPAPISKEFGRVYEEQNLGIPLEEALKGMCERVPNLDLRFFVTSVAIQRQTGGDGGNPRSDRTRDPRAIQDSGTDKGTDGGRPPVRHRSDRHANRSVLTDALDETGLHPPSVDRPMGIKMSLAAIILVLIGAYAIRRSSTSRCEA